MPVKGQRRITTARFVTTRCRSSSIVGGEVEEEAVFDDTGDQFQVVGKAGGVVDDAAFRVVDQVAPIGADQSALGGADAGGHGDLVVDQDVGDAVARRLVAEGDDTLHASVTTKIGPVKATFKGQVTMSDMVENKRLVITGEGKGGAAGFAKGGAEVTLAPTDSGATLLSYEVDAKVGGKLAQLGSRIIDGFAKKMADQFFQNLQTTIEGPAPEDEASDAPEEKKKGWIGRLTGRD